MREIEQKEGKLVMQHTGHQEGQNSAPRSFWSRSNIALIGFLAIAGFYLLAEHRAHVFGYLPFLLLLACPLLHMLMHRGHGSHGGGEQGNSADKRTGTPPPPAAGGHQH